MDFAVKVKSAKIYNCLNTLTYAQLIRGSDKTENLVPVSLSIIKSSFTKHHKPKTFVNSIQILRLRCLVKRTPDAYQYFLDIFYTIYIVTSHLNRLRWYNV